MVFRAFCVVLSFGNSKEKGIFLLYFSHLFVPLICRSKVLTFENPKRNLVFLFGFCSLNRTFVCEIY